MGSLPVDTSRKLERRQRIDVDQFVALDQLYQIGCIQQKEARSEDRFLWHAV